MSDQKDADDIKAAVAQLAMEQDDPALRNYYDMLEASGASDFDVVRAFLFAADCGFDAFPPVGCAVFDTPTCGDVWCYNPQHQQFVPFGEIRPCDGAMPGE
jgi:hypothetical protein